ncbi:GFA family protein [Dokdonella soli]|uniref:GFA family protein n=1 Tax=Dokdonella soli TaxID=529810 RepID=A0ABN1ID79_9GAMM
MTFIHPDMPAEKDVKSSIHEGGCLCGAIRYRAKADPVALTLCHCRSCRRATGGPSVAWAVFPASAFEFIAGSPVRFRSSPSVVRSFCGTCGTSLAWQHDARPETMDVTTASLDHPDDFAPTCEIWIEHKLAWEALSASLPHYPRSSRDSEPVAQG